MRRKYGQLLQDADVKRWYENVGRGSQATADNYLRKFGNFCETHKLTPQKLAELPEKEIYNLLMDFVSAMEKQGYAGGYILSVMKAVKSWLSYNGRGLQRKVKIGKVQETPTLKDERVPTKEELKRIFLSGDKKARVASVLIAHSGLRLQVLGDYHGNDGLRIGDLSELTAKGGTVEFKQMPTLVVVRSSLSKAKHHYFTFLSEEGCEYLKSYLEERIRDGETLTDESSIIIPKLKMKPFIRTTNISDAIRNAIREAGFPWRPYVLRSYFDTQLMLAESKGLVLRDYRQFWMGHKGDIEHRYTVNKRKLPPQVIEDMREAYRRSQKYLQTAESESKEDVKNEFKKQLLLVAGFTPEEIEKFDFSEMDDGEFQKTVREKLLGGAENSGGRQKVVEADEVEYFVNQGWEFVAALPNNKLILRSPGRIPQ